MSLNLYDVLDVDEDATIAQIRTAWKTAIADLDPDDRRFRVFNEAARVLLDADKRAVYDADLAAQRDEAEPDETEAADAAPEEDSPEVEEGRPAARHETEAEVEDDEERAPAGRFATDPPDWALGAVGLLAVLALALAVWVATWPGTFGDPSPESRQEIRRDTTSSVAAAEEIAQVVLSYRHDGMDQQLAAAQEVMTPAYGKEWAAVLADLRPEVESQQTTVTAAVRGSAIADLSRDGNQAQVMVLVDQLVQKRGVSASELQMWATLRLIREDGTWLLEKICTTDPECG